MFLFYGHSHTRYPKEEEAVAVNNHTIVLNPGSAHRAEKTFLFNSAIF